MVSFKEADTGAFIQVAGICALTQGNRCTCIGWQVYVHSYRAKVHSHKATDALIQGSRCKYTSVENKSQNYLRSALLQIWVLWVNIIFNDKYHSKSEQDVFGYVKDVCLLEKVNV